MIYENLQDCQTRHQEYPDLAQSLKDHEFQRRRVAYASLYIRRGETVLDVGCNSGYFRRYCPQANYIAGIDLNPTLVKEASKRLDLVKLAAAEQIPFPDKSFDVVNVSAVLEQCFDPLIVMREAKRVAIRAVTGNTTHHAGTWGKHRTEKHAWQARSFTEEEIRNLLDQIGRITHLGTIDVNNPPEPQCWTFEVTLE